MKKLSVLTHPDCLDHQPGARHAESPDRLRAILAVLDHRDFAGVDRHSCAPAPRAALYAAHSKAYVDQILALAGQAAVLDADTVLSPGSVRAALLAAGGAMAAVDLVAGFHAQSAFVATRPPGHHAEAERAMGFCLFNNAAIAAHHARAAHGLTRVAVVDFDVHHGNGTQAIFWGNGDLFYASSHQMPCYPGTGAAHETGAAANIVNMPLAPGAGSAEFRTAWQDIGLPALAAFAPELLIISAGFDAHLADPLAQLTLGTDDFAWITAELVEIAAQCSDGRLVSLLEGGYNLHALADCTAAHLRELLKA